MDSLRAMGPLRGIILDLRDNPGGVLDAAVSICEMFTKTGAMIVSTKGRDESSSTVYTNSSVPYEAECPMAILINSVSASASEVVAGCLQDNDRAVICGEQSFGKGLVQSQFPTPYGTTLKMTTQRYYCPSGRCIQRRSYSANGSSDTLVIHPSFYTLNKRPMLDACGITPDTVMRESDLPAFVKHLVSRGVIARVATRYASMYQSLPVTFDPAVLLADVESEAAREGYDDFPVHAKLKELTTLTEADPAFRNIAAKMSALQSELTLAFRGMVMAHAERIRSLLRREVMMRFMGDIDFLAWQMRNDESVHQTADLLTGRRHESLLKPRVASR
jgi:carboxyl-terminal processing protease